MPTILLLTFISVISSCGTVPAGKGLPLPPLQIDPEFNAKKEIVQVDDTPFFVMHKDSFKKIDIMLLNRETDRDTCRKMYEAMQ